MGSLVFSFLLLLGFAKIVFDLEPARSLNILTFRQWLLGWWSARRDAGAVVCAVVCSCSAGESDTGASCPCPIPEVMQTPRPHGFSVCSWEPTEPAGQGL